MAATVSQHLLHSVQCVTVSPTRLNVGLLILFYRWIFNSYCFFLSFILGRWNFMQHNKGSQNTTSSDAGVTGCCSHTIVILSLLIFSHHEAPSVWACWDFAHGCNLQYCSVFGRTVIQYFVVLSMCQQLGSVNFSAAFSISRVAQ